MFSLWLKRKHAEINRRAAAGSLSLFPAGDDAGPAEVWAGDADQRDVREGPLARSHVGRPVYEMYSPQFLNEDLSAYLEPRKTFAGRWPRDFLMFPRPETLAAWRLVGGKDILSPSDEGDRPDDGYPVVLEDWIERDGLKCLKVKLRGDDAGWGTTTGL